jgi:hypothetical protein
MRQDIVERVRPQMPILRMRIACWIPKATNTHPEYIIFIAFLLQQWLRQRPSMLRYTCIACIFLLLGTFIILCSSLSLPELSSNTDSVKDTYTAVSSVDDTASKEGMLIE